MVLGPIGLVAMSYIRVRDYQKAVVPKAEDVIPKEQHILTAQASGGAVVRKIHAQRPLQVHRVGAEAGKDLAASLFGVPEILAEHNVNDVEVSVDAILPAVADELRHASRFEDDGINRASTGRAAAA